MLTARRGRITAWFALLVTTLSGSGCVGWRATPMDLRGMGTLDSTKVYRATLADGRSMVLWHPHATADSITWWVPKAQPASFPPSKRKALAWEDVSELRERKFGILNAAGFGLIFFLGAAFMYGVSGAACCG